jgi:hypothetical protein
MKERKIIMSNDLVSTFEGVEDGHSFERILKFTNEGKFIELDGTIIDGEEPYWVYATRRRLRRWEDKRPTFIPPVAGETLQDTADRLNAEIPKVEWPFGLTGQQEAPIKPVYGVRLFRPRDGALFTLEHDTTGQRIAVGEPTQQINVTRALRGEVFAVVKLHAKPWKTSFGARLRPHYEIVGWRRNGEGKPALTQIEDKFTDKNVAAIGEPVEPVTIQEELNDDLPDHLKK